MAIFVVVLHAHPMLDISESWDFYISGGITRIAVPFFFTASGFFLFRKIDTEKFEFNDMKKYCYRLMKMYLVWTLVYMPFHLREIYQADNHLKALLGYIKNIILIGSHYHLWYLLASVVAVIAIGYLLRKGFSLNKIAWLGFAAFIIPMLSRGYYGFYLMMFPDGSIINDIMVILSKVVSPINGITEGVLYVTLGAIIAKGGFRFSYNTVLAGCILSWIIWNVENVLLYQYGICTYGNTASLTVVPAVLFTFLLSLNIRLGNWHGWKILREMSLYIYLIHPIFLWVVNVLYNKVFMIPTNHLAIFAIALVITMIVSYGWVRYKSKIRV